jgi:hypothetical protein
LKGHSPSVSWLINCLFVGARRREKKLKKGQKNGLNGEEGRGD